MQRNTPSHCWVSEMMLHANVDALHWQLQRQSCPMASTSSAMMMHCKVILWNWLVGSSINIVLIDTKRSSDLHGNWSNPLGPMPIELRRWLRPKSCAETLLIPPRPIWDQPNLPMQSGNWRHNIWRNLASLWAMNYWPKIFQ